MRIRDTLGKGMAGLATMLTIALVLTPLLFLPLAYAAGVRRKADSALGDACPSAVSGMMRSLLGSAIGLVIGAAPFLAVDASAPEGGASFALLIWFLAGPLICLLAIPLAHLLIAPSLGRGAGAMASPWRSLSWMGGAAAAAAVLTRLFGGTLTESLAAGAFMGLIWVCWKIYRKLMAPMVA